MSTQFGRLIASFLKRREVILFVIFFVVGTLSFGLGYLYAKDINKTPIVIQKVVE
ncbi:MAG: hypothetical protein Q8R26_03635 [bacterium]|nr:hypothetical protein [bacterium]